MSKRALIMELVFLLLVVILTQAITEWLGSNDASVHVANRDASSSFPLGEVHLTGGCSVGSAGGCPDPK